ncbi:HlyD family secretion protein [Emcibacter nanhaiensis]|uniref:HlyD family secretion protein n=1 Tax=Emcibacter nanhaiensis TaxID=1505037 RepID=A0A501PQ62_9PROT|nr:HlyD family secretion protein [Emcibacter nanhaiensis]TPD62573.1 HlyD family secretion protein [Emcibacter nanhaiensis]
MTKTTSTKDRKKQRKAKLRFTLLVVGPVVAILIGGAVYLSGGRFVETENAYVKSDKLMVAAEVSGPVTRVPVRENQQVSKGDILFYIDDRPYRIAFAEKEAGLKRVGDDIAGLKASYRQKQEELELAETNLAYARTVLDRQSELVASRNVSQTSYDAAKHAFDSARVKIRVIESEKAEVLADLAGDPNIAPEQHPRYIAAKAALDRARLDLERTIVRAPFDGIASSTPKVGQQVVGSGALSSPVMTLVDNRDFWIVANFKETDLTNVRPGQTVKIHVDTYPGLEWHGTVESLAQATGSEFSVIPAQNATGNWVKVVQRIPVRIALNSTENDALLRSGMSTSVEIDTGHKRSLGQIISAMFRKENNPAIQTAHAETTR